MKNTPYVKQDTSYECYQSSETNESHITRGGDFIEGNGVLLENIKLG